MAASVDEFRDLLSAEQNVDLPRLRHFSKHGVPDQIRGKALHISIIFFWK